MKAALPGPASNARCHDPVRRRWLLAALGWPAATAAGCAAALPPPRLDDWLGRLQGDTVALLGEVHDNPMHHRLRAAALRHACARGWRPALVMEQFDLERQADIDRARAERPRDARHLITHAGGASGWDWDEYEPLIAIALEHELPLVAGNLSRQQAARIMREGYEAVLGADRVASWGLGRQPDAAWQQAQEQEINHGHCNALPKAMWASMARAQFARDAALAHLLERHAAGGAVLLAGNGHVRRDIGVPRWFDEIGASRTLVVGFIEAGGPDPLPNQFDEVVRTARAPRADPCERFRSGPPRQTA